MRQNQRLQADTWTLLTSSGRPYEVGWNSIAEFGVNDECWDDCAEELLRYAVDLRYGKAGELKGGVFCLRHAYTLFFTTLYVEYSI